MWLLECSEALQRVCYMVAAYWLKLHLFMIISTAWVPYSVYGIFFPHLFYCPTAKIESVIPCFGLQVYSEHSKLLAVKQTHPDTEIEMYSTFVMVQGNIWTDKKVKEQKRRRQCYARSHRQGGL